MRTIRSGCAIMNHRLSRRSYEATDGWLERIDNIPIRRQQRMHLMVDFEPVLLRRILKKASPSLEAYRADGGYRALAKAVNEMTREQVVQAVKDSGLRGRGGAGFPCGVKWTFLPKDHPGPIFLCVNGDESEPGTFNNRILIEEDPHQFLEGIIISCYATRAWKAYIYIRYEYGRAFRAMQKAIDEAYAGGLLGQNLFGKGFNLDVYL